MDLFSQLTIVFTGVKEEIEGSIRMFCLGKLKIETVILAAEVSGPDSTDNGDVLANFGNKNRKIFLVAL